MDRLIGNKGDLELLTQDGINIFKQDEPDCVTDAPDSAAPLSNPVVKPLEDTVQEIVSEPARIIRSINSDLDFVSKEPLTQTPLSLGARAEAILRKIGIKGDQGGYVTPVAPIKRLVAGVLLSAILTNGCANFSVQYDAGQDMRYNKEHTEVIAANTVATGLLAGITAKIQGRPFTENFLKGSAGGALIGTGKYLVGQDKDLAWPAKLITASGASIATNASQGDGAFDYMGIDLGPLYLNFAFKKKFRVMPQLDIASGLVIVNKLANGYKFNSEDSLRFGTPIFYTGGFSAINSTNANAPVEEDIHGATLANIISLRKNLDRAAYDRAVRHELVHTHQYVASAVPGRIILDSIFKVDLKEAPVRADNFVGWLTVNGADTLLFKYGQGIHEREAYKLAK